MKKWMPCWNKKARMTPSRMSLATPTTWTPTIAAKITASAERGIFLSLPSVAHLFSLSPFEVQTVIMCLAPELRRKYDTLYAYLQDDITRKRPSVDLVLDVLCASEAERWRARTGVRRPGSAVSAWHPPQGGGPSESVRRPVVWRNSSSSTNGCSTISWGMIVSTDVSTGTPPCCILPQRWRRSWWIRRSKPAWCISRANGGFLSHPFGRHNRSSSTSRDPMALANATWPWACARQWGCPLLYVDMELLLAREPDVATALRLVFREGLLWDAAIYVDHVDALLQEDGKAKAWVKTLARTGGRVWPTHLSGGRTPLVSAGGL